MKQSAVEWLEKEINSLLEKYESKEISTLDFIIIKHNLFDRAKEMEKQQQGYSEKEVIELLQKALTHKDDGEIGSLVTAQGEIRTANFHSWFNKFKNK
jgi:hypothetical protein